MNDTVTTCDPILRAYANLRAVREHLGSGYIHQQGFYEQYGRALDELQQAGVDVSEWRIPANAVGEIHGKEFRAKIDAILIYFDVQKEGTRVGFRY